jgi:FMN phosphatase YigB (HAD superfamily)
MTYAAISTPIGTGTSYRIHQHSAGAGVDAVLFDLSGTLLDESYIRCGLVHLGTFIEEWLGIDSAATIRGFMPSLRIVSAADADQPFHMMRDRFCAALDHLIASHGHTATRGELVYLEHELWLASIPAAVAAEGAIEMLTVLRDAGIRTGIVSYADIGVFDGLLHQTGLAGLTDVELCSEMARSCKPDPAIFLQALAAVSVAPDRAMFVGDCVESDIVGGNRVGMRTALLSNREFTEGDGSTDDPLREPDHHIDHLLDVVELAIHHRPVNRCA